MYGRYVASIDWPGRRQPTSENFSQWPSYVVKTIRKLRCCLCSLVKRVQDVKRRTVDAVLNDGKEGQVRNKLLDGSWWSIVHRLRYVHA